MRSSAFVFCTFLLFNTHGLSQDSAHTKRKESFGYDRLKYTLTKNEKWAKNDETKTFESQGRHHSAYFALNSDSTFIFISTFEVGNFFSTGKYLKQDERTIKFMWNKNLSSYACKNERICRRYSSYFSPRPLKIENWVFAIEGDTLFPTTP